MVLQLCVFSLLTLFLMLAGQFILPVPGGSADPRFGRARTASERAERLNDVIRAALRTYAVFAPYALLMYLQGKPDLLPQYLAWLVIALELAKGIAIFVRRLEVLRFLGIVNVAVLLFLWLQQLPLFQPPPG